jgi:hypothetical protein
MQMRAMLPLGQMLRNNGVNLAEAHRDRTVTVAMFRRNRRFGAKVPRAKLQNVDFDGG